MRRIVRLTDRHIAALQHMADGKMYTGTAAAMNVNYDAVRALIRQSLDILGAVNVTHAVAICIRRSIID